MVFLKQGIPNSPLTNHQHFEIQKSWLAYSSDLILFFSECSLASPGSTCTNLGERDCKYEYIGDHCCCGQCSDSSWLSLACVPDSTTGEGVWQQQLCPVGGCDSQGEWLTFRQNTVRHNLKEFLPQEMSPRRTTLAAIQTTSTEQKS